MTLLVTPGPVTLTGRLVELRPLAREHRDGLIEAVTDGNLHETAWYTSAPAPNGAEAEIDRRLALQEKGEMVPFTAVDASARIIGTTTLYALEPTVPRLHIGYTWNRPSAHGTGTNAESKLLLLQHAFETLRVYRVGLTTQWVNFQSRAAIERLGAKQDSVMRAMSRYRNGALRDSVEFSIIEPEWPAVRANLEARLARRRSRPRAFARAQRTLSLALAAAKHTPLANTHCDARRRCQPTVFREKGRRLVELGAPCGHTRQRPPASRS